MVMFIDIQGFLDRAVEATELSAAGTYIPGLGEVFRGACWYTTDSPGRQTRIPLRNRRKLINATPRPGRRRGGPHVRRCSTLASPLADLLVIPDPPALRGARGSSGLDIVVESMGLKFAVNGNRRDRSAVEVGRDEKKPMCRSVGFRGITAADGNATVIVPRGPDDRRNFRQQELNFFAGSEREA